MGVVLWWCDFNHQSIHVNYAGDRHLVIVVYFIISGHQLLPWTWSKSIEITYQCCGYDSLTMIYISKNAKRCWLQSNWLNTTKNKKNTTIKQYNINKIIIRTIVRENCVKPPYAVDETGDTDLWFSVWSLPLFSSGIFPGLSFTPHSPRRTFPSYLTAPPLPPI